MSQDDRARDYLANERTFLAWIRTGVAFIGVGFVIARFGGSTLFGTPSAGPLRLGLVAMAMGALIALEAALQHRSTLLLIRTGEYRPRSHFLYALSAGTLLLAIIAAAVLLLF